MTPSLFTELSLLKNRRRYNPKTGSRTIKLSIRLYREELDTLIEEAMVTGVSLGKLVKQKLTKGK